MKKSLQQYRRLGALGYARWVCEANGVEFDEVMVGLMDNHAIHAHVESLLAPADEPAPLVEEEVVNPFPADLQEYDSLTVAELRALCKERGLPVYGTKAEIVLRLKQNDEGIIPVEEPESPAEAALEGDSEAPTEEVAASNGEETNEKDSGNQQEPIIEE